MNQGITERLLASCKELLGYVEAEYGYTGEPIEEEYEAIDDVCGVIIRGRRVIAEAEATLDRGAHHPES